MPVRFVIRFHEVSLHLGFMHFLILILFKSLATSRFLLRLHLQLPACLSAGGAQDSDFASGKHCRGRATLWADVQGEYSPSAAESQFPASQGCPAWVTCIPAKDLCSMRPLSRAEAVRATLAAGGLKTSPCGFLPACSSLPQHRAPSQTHPLISLPHQSRPSSRILSFMTS